MTGLRFGRDCGSVAAETSRPDQMCSNTFKITFFLVVFDLVLCLDNVFKGRRHRETHQQVYVNSTCKV